MDIFLAGSPVSLVVPLQDRNGNTVEASAVEYRVVKQGGEELLARTLPPSLRLRTATFFPQIMPGSSKELSSFTTTTTS